MKLFIYQCKYLYFAPHTEYIYYNDDVRVSVAFDVCLVHHIQTVQVAEVIPRLVRKKEEEEGRRKKEGGERKLKGGKRL